MVSNSLEQVPASGAANLESYTMLAHFTHYKSYNYTPSDKPCVAN